MITTITTLGCSVRTSMRRIVALSIAGAVATASRLVISERRSVVTRSASSSSRRTRVRSSAATAVALVGHRQQAVDEVALPGVASACRPAEVCGWASRPWASSCGELGADRRGAPDELGVGGERLARRPAGRSRRSSRRPCAGSSLGGASASSPILRGAQRADGPRRRVQGSSSALAPRIDRLAVLARRVARDDDARPSTLA